MLTLQRFRELADSYGGRLQRWPDELRGDAQHLLQVSADARAILAVAQALDEDIEKAGAVRDARVWHPGDDNAALARLRAGVKVRIAAPLPTHDKASFGLAGIHRWLRIFHLPITQMVTAGVCAIAVGLATGALYLPRPAPSDMLTALLQPVPLHILAD